MLENDYELVYFAQEKDEIAYKMLYDKFSPMINNKIKYYAKVAGNSADIEDLKQVALWGFDKAINNFTEKKNVIFYTFLLVCIEGELRNYLRNISSKKNKILSEAISLDETEDDISLLDVIPSDTDSPSYLLEEKEEYNILEEKINSVLSSLENEVLKLKLKGYSYKDIGKILNKSIKSIDGSVQRIKKKLKVILEM